MLFEDFVWSWVFEAKGDEKQWPVRAQKYACVQNSWIVRLFRHLIPSVPYVSAFFNCDRNLNAEVTECVY